MLGENSWKGPRELSLPRDFTPLLLKRNVSFDVSERGRIPHFLLKFFHFYVSRFNNLKLQSPRAAAGEWRTHDSWFIIVCFPPFSLPPARSHPCSLPTWLHPGRQVLGLRLTFCIVDFDGTGDALYCAPDIPISPHPVPSPGYRLRTLLRDKEKDNPAEWGISHCTWHLTPETN